MRTSFFWLSIRKETNAPAKIKPDANSEKMSVIKIEWSTIVKPFHIYRKRNANKKPYLSGLYYREESPSGSKRKPSNKRQKKRNTKATCDVRSNMKSFEQFKPSNN